MTVECLEGPPTLEEAAEWLNLPVEGLDTDFGIVLISPDRHLYAVKVLGTEGEGEFDPKRGPFSDPTIAPMGGDEP